MNFTTGKTKIEGLLQKKDQIFDAAAKNVADVILSAKGEGKLSMSYEKNISNLLNGFDDHERSIILTKSILYLALNTTTTDDDDSDTGYHNYFSRRTR